MRNILQTRMGFATAPVLATATMLAVLLAMTPSVFASEIVNGDSRAHEIELIEADARSTISLAPGERSAAVCVGGCILRIVGAADGDYELEGDERATIEDGLLYFDGVVPGADGAAGKAEQPPPSDPAR